MLDFTDVFTKYESLVREVEKAVTRTREAFPDGYRCAKQCSDCCFAVFDLSLMESIYINIHFFNTLAKGFQAQILERADRADRQAYRIKRKLHTLITREGKSESEVLSLLAEERIRCPFLGESDLCDLYDFRPITCRVYGLPTSIQGAGHTCGKSGFREGIAYPTINMDRINQHLTALSRELLEEVGARDIRLQDRLVPLSTALLSDYDGEYFGLNPACSD